MKVSFAGRDYQYEDRANTVPMLKIVTRETGLKWPVDFSTAVGEWDPDAIAALIWLVKTQNGYQGTIDDACADVSAMDFLDAYGTAAMAEQAKQEEQEDPQPPVVEDGSTPTTSATSETSTSPASL